MNALPRIVIVVWLCAMVTGCASAVAGVTKGLLDKVMEPDPTSIDAALEGSAGLNPDPNGRPSPLVFRIYSLSSPKAFDDADFFALYKNDEATLGPDLIAREELAIAPSESRVLQKELKEGTLYLGVMAAYRNINNARWRASVQLEPNDENLLRIRFDDLAVTLEARDD